VAERLAVLEGRLQKSPFVAGNAFGVADIATALSSHRGFSTPIENGPRWRTAQTP
jgi:glutathione S-transferase